MLAAGSEVEPGESALFALLRQSQEHVARLSPTELTAASGVDPATAHRRND